MTIKAKNSELPKSLYYPNNVRWTIVSQSLNAIMALRGISAVELARRTNLSGSLIRNFRNGYHTGTTQGTLNRICYVLDVTPDSLASRVEETA